MDDLITWYKDKNLAIYFDRKPVVIIRVITPEMPAIDKKAIAKYPFQNVYRFNVTLVDFKKGKEYQFPILKGFCYDGASIPRVFWRLIGSNTDPRFLIASLIHDVLCLNHNYVANDRNFSSKVFRALLREAGVSKIKAQTMYLAVDNYQRCCRWGKKNG